MSLSPKDLELLTRARAGLSPTRTDRARLRAGIATSIAAGSAAAGAAPTLAIGAGWGSLALKLGGLSLLAAGVVVGVSHYGESPPRRPHAVSAVAQPREAVAPFVPEPKLTAQELPQLAPPVASAQTRKSAVPALEREGALSQETKLIAEANLALRSGNGPKALSLLEEHARRFPSGVLAEEREAEQIRALCAAGRTSKARESAARFARERPASALLSKVKHGCEN